MYSVAFSLRLKSQSLFVNVASKWTRARHPDDVEPEVVGRSVGNCQDRQILELPPPIRELRFENFALQPTALPNGVVGVLDREIFQRRGAVSRKRLVES